MTLLTKTCISPLKRRKRSHVCGSSKEAPALDKGRTLTKGDGVFSDDAIALKSEEEIKVCNSYTHWNMSCTTAADPVALRLRGVIKEASFLEAFLL